MSNENGMLKSFFRDFRDRAESFVYLDRIQEMIEYEKQSIILDYNHLTDFNHNFAFYLLQNPDEVLNTLKDDFISFLRELNDEYFYEKRNFDLQLINLPVTHKIQLRNMKKGIFPLKIVEFDGLIIKIKKPVMALIDGFYQCNRCLDVTIVKEELDGKLIQPKKCEFCDCKEFTLLEGDSTFIQKQELEIKEPITDIIGEMPTLTLTLRNDLSKMNLHKGDLISIIGLPYLHQLKKNSNDFETRLKVINVIKKD